eukprot:359761-Prymnesium_polylepis.2
MRNVHKRAETENEHLPQGGADGDRLCNRRAAFNLQHVTAQIDLYTGKRHKSTDGWLTYTKYKWNDNSEQEAKRPMLDTPASGSG